MGRLRARADRGGSTSSCIGLAPNRAIIEEDTHDAVWLWVTAIVVGRLVASTHLIGADGPASPTAGTNSLSHC